MNIYIYIYIYIYICVRVCVRVCVCVNIYVYIYIASSIERRSADDWVESRREENGERSTWGGTVIAELVSGLT